MHRQRQDFSRRPLAFGQIAGFVAQERIRLLQVDRQGVIDGRLDAARRQMLLQGVAPAFGNAHGVLVVDVVVAPLDAGQDE